MNAPAKAYWMDNTFTRNASDLLKICVTLGGYSMDEIKPRIIAHPADRKINAHTVEKWLGEIYEEHKHLPAPDLDAAYDRLQTLLKGAN